MDEPIPIYPCPCSQAPITSHHPPWCIKKGCFSFLFFVIKLSHFVQLPMSCHHLGSSTNTSVSEVPQTYAYFAHVVSHRSTFVSSPFVTYLFWDGFFDMWPFFFNKFFFRQEWCGMGWWPHHHHVVYCI